MRLNTVNILGINITKASKETILEYLKKYLGKSSEISRQRSEKVDKPLVIFTPNPEQVVLAQKNPAFLEILNKADVAIPDGVGIIWASRLLSSQSSEVSRQVTLQRIAGVELMEDLVRIAAKEGVSVGLIGGGPNIAVKALECLREAHSELKGWGETPPMLNAKGQMPNGQSADSYIETLAKRIQKTGVRLVFVGLGAPKQEYFIEMLATKVVNSTSTLERQDKKASRSTNYDSRVTNSIIFMSVGGAFDEISGRIPRPPKFVDFLGLKWLWRLILEPWRWKRQLALFEFVRLVLKSYINRYTTI